MLKTHKATAKRFRPTRRGKFERRRAGQDHFNARESGKVGRNKRRDLIMPATERRVLSAALPHA